MEKKAFTLMGIIDSRNSFYLFLIVIPLFFQSCAVGLIQASADGNRQVSSGPSYPEKSTNDMNVGANIGIVLETSGGSSNSGSEGSSSFKNGNLANFGNSYADNPHGPSEFFNSGENEEKENANTSKAKASSDLMSHIRFMGGIEFIQKNSKDGGTKITLNYLQIPLYVLYNYTLSGGNIFGGLGPYFAYGIGGKMKSNYNGQTTEMKSFDKTTGYKPFDAGLGLTAGYKITNSFSFSLAYNYGLANIDRNAFGDKSKNRGISLNVRYPLNKIFKKQ